MSKKSRERVQQARDLAGDDIETSIQTLKNLRDGAEDEKVRMQCALALIDRAAGKSTSPLADEELQTRAELQRMRAREIDLLKEVEELRQLVAGKPKAA